MLYVVLTMPTLNKAYLYLFIIIFNMMKEAITWQKQKEKEKQKHSAY